MEHSSIHFLIITLVILFLMSAFFSGAEIGMMSLNRYRLKHLVKKKHRAARRVAALLKRPDRLLGVVLIGNTFANIFASAVTTILTVKLFGEAEVAIATAVLTLIILIFAEVLPKTLAASTPLKFSFLVSWPLTILLKILYPLVWLTNFCANSILKLVGAKVDAQKTEYLTGEELRTVVYEAGELLPTEHKRMLLSIFDLSKVTVEDIMVPRNEINGIDLHDDWENILDQLTHSQHTRLPLYRGTMEKVEGIIHVRQVLNALVDEALSKDMLTSIAESNYFVPISTALNVQLLNFQKEKRRIALVVDEYGEMIGLVTLEDILEEIVGQFTTDMATSSKDIHPQDDGSIVVDASITLRELNRALKWRLPKKGPKTLSGLIIEYAEMIPPPGTCLRLHGHKLEVMKIEDNVVRSVRFLKTKK